MLSKVLESKMNPEAADVEEDESPTEEEEEISSLEFDELKEDAIEYLAGFLIKKCKVPNDPYTSCSFTWVDQKSEGGLKKPNETFLKNVTILESIFMKYNKEHLYTEGKFMEKHLKKAEAVPLDISVKKLFFKCRLYFRIKHLNKLFLTQINCKDRKIIKTIQ